jgi:hypothetical protein
MAMVPFQPEEPGCPCFSLGHSHMVFMAEWQKSYTREPTKTKVELRRILAEAVRNQYRPRSKRLPKPKKIAAKAAYVD